MSWYHLLMDDSYKDAVEALRATVAEYEGTLAQEVAAKAASVFLDYLPSFLGEGVDAVTVAKALFLACSVMVMTRDESAEDVDHLVQVDEEGSCEDEECRFDHEDLDTGFLGGQLEGMEAMIAAIAGMALGVVDTIPPDFDEIDWSQSKET